jgi:N4-(beta-N-acetylglucosaminyl)-L-asparaginase
MSKGRISRRDLLVGSAAVGVGALAKTATPTVWIQSSYKPIIAGSGNALGPKNGGPRTCIEEAFMRLTRGDDILESLVAGVNIVELDPADTSVGYGGLPNAHGVVQLDSCCMHGPKKRAGGVACIEGVKTPASVAMAVANLTDHHLIVGKGATDLARNFGFEIHQDLNTDTSRAAWLEWMRRSDPGHYPTEKDREIGGIQVALQMAEEGWFPKEHVFGTINCIGMNSKGDVAGVTTTSGLAFKIPGRVGDSPILGAGLYVDNDFGAAGSTGRGEANLYGLCSYHIVEEMRRGAHPKDAGLSALKRVRENTIEKRLLNEKGHPAFGLNFYIVDKKGRHAGVAMAGRSKFAVCDENGPRLEDCEPLIPA